jgi:hypothetical protein
VKAFKPVFWHLFKKYGGKNIPPNEPFSMVNSEFMQLVTQAQLINECLPERDISLHFLLAQVPVINELQSNRDTRATFVEFAEALVRCIDAASL